MRKLVLVVVLLAGQLVAGAWAGVAGAGVQVGRRPSR